MKSAHRQLCLPFISIAIFAFFALSGCQSRVHRPAVLDRAETVNIAATDPANYGQPVRITGVVTYVDRDWHLLFLQDESGGLFVNLPEEVPDLEAGRLLQVSGKLAPSGRGIDAPQFRVLGPAPMPTPQALPYVKDPTTARLSQWVQFQGTIRAAAIEDGRLTLTVVNSDGRRIKVRVLNRKQTSPITCVGATVEVSGVLAAAVDGRGNTTGIQVFVSSIEQVRPTDGKGFGSPFTTKPQPFSSAKDKKQIGSLVHLAGTAVAVLPRRLLVVGDGTTTVTAQLSDSYEAGPGDSVEVLGFVGSSPSFDLEDAIVRVVAPRTLLKESEIKGALTTVRKLKSLSVESAAKRLHVDISGTVTFFDPSRSLLFVQDATGGVYVDIHNGVPDVSVGDRVRVRGLSGPGDYAPIITGPSIVRTGRSSIPKPLSLSWQTVASGQDDASWVEVVGVVHSVLQLRDQHLFKLVVAGNSYAVEFPHSERTDADPDSLLDATVRVRGVCGAVFNERRQLVGLRFYVPSAKYVETVEAAPPEPSIETRPIISLLRFDPLNISVHRTKVRGVVTLVNADHGFYLQDSSAGIYVIPDGKQPVSVGQSVEVLGFAVANHDGPYLEDARISLVPQSLQVSPVRVTTEDLATGMYQSQLVTVQGTLIERERGPVEDTLLLRVGNVVLRATLPSPQVIEQVRRSSLLEVTGILHNDGRSNQNSFRISVPSTNNIRVIQAASWWTPEHIIRTLILAIIAILFVLLWLSFMAYRVRSYQANHDLLTDLPNRRSVLDYLDRQLARATREKTPMGVILADVDNFKKVNDTYGHQTGDAVLKRMAEILRVELRPYDAVGRHGGEEFLMVVTNCNAETAREIANRIRVRVQEEPFTNVLGTQTFHVTCSFGVAEAEPSMSVNALLASADRALYAAKASGRNRVITIDDLRLVMPEDAHHFAL